MEHKCGRPSCTPSNAFLRLAANVSPNRLLMRSRQHRRLAAWIVNVANEMCTREAFLHTKQCVFCDWRPTYCQLVCSGGLDSTYVSRRMEHKCGRLSCTPSN